MTASHVKEFSDFTETKKIVGDALFLWKSTCYIINTSPVYEALYWKVIKKIKARTAKLSQMFMW